MCVARSGTHRTPRHRGRSPRPWSGTGSSGPARSAGDNLYGRTQPRVHVALRTESYARKPTSPLSRVRPAPGCFPRRDELPAARRGRSREPRSASARSPRWSATSAIRATPSDRPRGGAAPPRTRTAPARPRPEADEGRRPRRPRARGVRGRRDGRTASKSESAPLSARSALRSKLAARAELLAGLRESPRPAGVGRLANASS